uniref:Uncharacterized protein n=1 Tax=Nelumbo nucifera TaxID=4432 RepID=A0A822YPS5_NELNU|nr:TPA_asm: hypothetical protein HUJ06_006814 [Nelumbo nucifera]
MPFLKRKDSYAQKDLKLQMKHSGLLSFEKLERLL